jgi:hypothetical protein
MPYTSTVMKRIASQMKAHYKSQKDIKKEVESSTTSILFDVKHKMKKVIECNKKF